MCTPARARTAQIKPTSDLPFTDQLYEHRMSTTASHSDGDWAAKTTKWYACARLTLDCGLIRDRNAKAQKGTPVKRAMAPVSTPVPVNDNNNNNNNNDDDDDDEGDDTKEQQDVSQTQIQPTRDENAESYDGDQFENDDDNGDAPLDDTLASSQPIIIMDAIEPPSTETTTSSTSTPLSAVIPSIREPLAENAARPRESMVTGGLFPLKSEPTLTTMSTLTRARAQAVEDDDALYLDFIATVTQDIVTHEIYSTRSVRESRSRTVRTRRVVDWFSLTVKTDCNTILRGVKALFARHVDERKDKLDEERMMKLLDQLKVDLGIAEK